MTSTDRLTIEISDGVTIKSSDGYLLPLPGARSQALIALLCAQSNFRASRVWIESTLWSTRDHEQASGSLRQLLSQTKRSLGLQEGWLKADRQAIWLDEASVFVQVNDASDTQALLSGILIRDRAFKTWVLDFRKNRTESKRSIGANFSEKATLLISADHSSSVGHSMLQELVAHQTMRNLAESSDIQSILGEGYSIVSGQHADLLLTCKFQARKEDSFATLHLRAVPSGVTKWSRTIALPAAPPTFDPNGPIAEACYALSHHASDQVMRAVGTDVASEMSPRRADALTQLALSELFSFDLSRIEYADRLLERAHELQPHPIRLAWRSCALMFKFVEGSGESFDLLLQQNKNFEDQVLETGSENSLALALLSQSRLLLSGDEDGAEQMALDASALNSGSPFTLVARANVSAAKGNHRAASGLLKQGLKMGSPSSMRHWWSMFLALSHIRQGDYELAIDAAVSASIRARSFRAPLRHLYPLYLKMGEIDKARDAINRLRELEPGYSLEQVRANPKYPASSLRSSSLIELEDLPEIRDGVIQYGS